MRPIDVADSFPRVRVVSWNLNSIRARLEHLLSVIDRWEPDVLLLQETRCPDRLFPTSTLSELGYRIAHHGPDHRNGVAIASRVGLDDVHAGFAGLSPSDGALFGEARLLSATCGGMRVHSAYVPNGRTLDHPEYRHKLAWLAQLRDQMAGDVDNGIPTVLAGDFNVAPADIDMYDPSRFRRTTHASPPERAAIRAIEAVGLVDVMRARDDRSDLYTWWSYRPGQLERNRGLRIDLVFVDQSLQDRVTAIQVDAISRALPRASDHAPVVIDIDIGHTKRTRLCSGRANRVRTS